jgi:sarcosine oxidase
MARLRVAVIGVGGAGSAACYHLARAGTDVVGFEQFAVGHARGSSHGESRIIRYTYPDRLYTAMMADAYRLWADVEAEAGEELFVRCGGLYFGPEGHAEMAAVGDSLDAVGLPYETLDPAEVAARHPALCLAPGEYAYFQPESGFLRASRCVLAHARLARQYGAEIREGVTVEAVEPQPGGGVVVRTADGGSAGTFDRAVVTAGPWMGSLLSDLGLPLQVTRQEWVYLPLRDTAPPNDFAPGRLPVWIDAGTHWYGFPLDGAVPGAVKLALHAPGPPTNPETVTLDAAEADVLARTQGPEAAARYASERLPDLTLPAVHAGACLYTNAPSEDFLLDTLPGTENVYLISACSGHGFKFTTLLGSIAADWALSKPYGRDLSRFALARLIASAA